MRWFRSRLRRLVWASTAAFGLSLGVLAPVHLIAEVADAWNCLAPAEELAPDAAGSPAHPDEPATAPHDGCLVLGFFAKTATVLPAAFVLVGPVAEARADAPFLRAAPASPLRKVHPSHAPPPLS